MFVSQPFGQTLFKRFFCTPFQESEEVSLNTQIIAISNQKRDVLAERRGPYRNSTVAPCPTHFLWPFCPVEQRRAVWESQEHPACQKDWHGTPHRIITRGTDVLKCGYTFLTIHAIICLTGRYDTTVTREENQHMGNQEYFQLFEQFWWKFMYEGYPGLHDLDLQVAVQKVGEQCGLGKQE